MESVVATYAAGGDCKTLSLLIVFIYVFLQSQIGVIIWLMIQVKDLFVQMINEMKQLREAVMELKTELHYHEKCEAGYD
jgi:hypothetical protein